MSLDGIRNPVCHDCSLASSCRHICLMGEGTPTAEIMLVGEAPGESEDRSGRPFIGDAGQLLTSILTEFNIKREDIYITNAVKCRPPNNRTPNLKEIQACRQYLVEEIKAIRPKVIIGLGGIAMKSLLNLRKNFPIGSNRGATFFLGKTNKIPVVPTYHPAYIKRNEEAAAPTLIDFERALDILHNGVKEPSESHYYLGVPEPINNELVIDLETSGLDMFAPDGKIYCIGMTAKENEGWVTEIYDSGIQEYLTNPKILKIGHNIKFDYKWLRRQKVPFKGKMYDTMVAEHMLDENCPSYGLKELTLVHTDMGRYSEPFEKIYELVKKDMSLVPQKVLFNYCAKDADATKRMHNRQVPQLEAQGLMPLFELTMMGERVIADAELFGVNIDQDVWRELSGKYTIAIERHTAKLRETTGIEDFNPKSTQQLAEQLIDKLGLPILKMTKKNKISMDKFVLEQLQPLDQSGIVTDILKLRELQGDYAKYLNPEYPPFLLDGKIHADFKINGADTGRYSCRNPNLMAITKKSPIRKMFISSFPGGRIGQIDFDQGELRILAQESQDKFLLDAFRSGKDIHTQTASEIFGISEDKVTEDQRFNAKTINFGIVYGMGTDKLAKTTGKSMIVAGKYLRAYKSKVKGVMDYIYRKEDEIVENGEVISLFGRRRRIAILSDDFKMVAAAKRKAVNSPIQGGLHDLNILCMVEFNRRMRKERYISRILLVVHDSVVLDIAPGEEKPLRKLAQEVFTNPDTSPFGFEFNVPLTISFESGPNWKEIQ